VTHLAITDVDLALTEMGPRPWIVQGLPRTSDAHSPSVSATTLGASLGVLALLDAALAALDVVPMQRNARLDPETADTLLRDIVAAGEWSVPRITRRQERLGLATSDVLFP
jgi:cytochrome bd-type quinol oxidase subunit 1